MTNTQAREALRELLANFETARLQWIQDNGTEAGFHEAFRNHVLSLGK